MLTRQTTGYYLNDCWNRLRLLRRVVLYTLAGTPQTLQLAAQMFIREHVHARARYVPTKIIIMIIKTHLQKKHIIYGFENFVRVQSFFFFVQAAFSIRGRPHLITNNVPPRYSERKSPLLYN